MNTNHDVRWPGVSKGPHLPQHTGSMCHNETAAKHTERILSKYRTIKEQHDSWTIDISLFCSNTDCPVKWFQVTVSYQRDPGYELVHAFACPYCGRFAVLNGDDESPVRDTAMQKEREERNARQSVWQQIKRHRNHQRGLQLVELKLDELEKEVDIAQLARLLETDGDRDG